MKAFPPDTGDSRQKKSKTDSGDPYCCGEPDELDLKACSATDCTGLIPSLPQSDAELESYAQIYHYPADIFQD
ncbi:MAG: hypothetical protein Q4C73_05265 [Eubacteriales bacterium]|nr:hypothetical protein [Eubacteriales bacterium]